LRKRRALSASGVGREGERKRTTDDVSKYIRRHQNRGHDLGLGISLTVTCLPVRRCPAYRWREPGSGSGMEHGNLSPRYGGPLVGREREDPEQWMLRRGRVPMRGTGADRLVVVVKPGNAGGAKGTGCPGSFGGQPQGRSR
jgi:hypothetical protein